MQSSDMNMKSRRKRDGATIQVGGAAGLQGLKELKRTHQKAQTEGGRMRQKRG